MDRWAVAALVILLASAYSQYSAHERLVGALGTRIALLEKQADDARAQDANERVLLRGALEKLTVTLEGQAAQGNTREWVNETASDIMTEMEHLAQVRHLRELLVLSELYSSRRSSQFDFRRAKQAGFTFEQVFAAVDEANCPLDQCLRLLKQAGYTEACTEYVGFTANQMMQASCTEDEVASLLARLKTDGASFEDAKAALFGAPSNSLSDGRAVATAAYTGSQYRVDDKWRMLRMAGYSCAEAHSTIDDLNSKWKSLGCDEASAAAVGTAASASASAAASADEQDESVSESCAKLRRVYEHTLRDGRAFCQDPLEIAGILRDMGLSASDAVHVGYTPDEMRRAGYSMQEIARETLAVHSNDPTDPHQLQRILIQLKAAGLTCTEARYANFRPRQCKSAGYTFAEAKQAGYAYFELHWNRGDETESVHHNGWDID